jgi:hypothetical protein
LALFPSFDFRKSNSTSVQYATLQLKLEEEKSKHASLAQQNGFGPAFLYNLLRLVKGTAKPNTCQRRVY